MRIPHSGNGFDAAFAIESMPHAPDKAGAYGEVFRVLRPGACFAAYEWCLTGKFDARDAEHQRIRDDTMVGDGLPELSGAEKIRAALRKAGFELVEARDLAPDSDPETPWYCALARPLLQPGEAFRAHPPVAP